MIVELTWHEYYAAALVGMLRKTQSIHRKHQDGYGATMSSKPVYDSGWAVVSAASEMAAKSYMHICDLSVFAETLV